LYSYREAEKNLEQWNGHPRRVNNHTHVKRMTDKVGAVLSEHNQLAPAAEECAAPAQDMILQVDGGHIPIQEKDKRSFEALSAIVYRPEHLQDLDRHHRQIMEKTCVVSALDDQLQTIKTYVVNAAKKQGISQETQVTALADGAKNCWSVLSAIQPECATLECILDWFHIAQKFQNVKNALGEAFATSLERNDPSKG
jgi:predicted ArsR family transcriptional regulator